MHNMTIRLKSKSAAEALGESLRKARLRRKLSSRELAEKVGVDRSQISKIEHGRILLVSHNVQKICTFFGVRLEPFVGETTVDPAVLESRLLRLNVLLGGRQEGTAAVKQLLDALEAFAESYSA